MSAGIAFERSHSITIAAPPRAVFDYVTNPHSWPEWIAASHQLACENRPLVAGETFVEQWGTQRGEVQLDWVVRTCESPRLWIAETTTTFTGPIVVQYTCEAIDAGTRYTRLVSNPARPKAPTDEMIARIDTEAETALANIKANVERRTR